MLNYQLVDSYIQDLYSCTYWGNFEVNDKTVKHTAHSDIIKNRNEFIYEYDIKDHLNGYIDIGAFISYGKNSNVKDFFDHVEVYRNNNDDYVLITNPYINNISYYRESIFTSNFGFQRIYNMYSKDSYTYIKIGKQHDFLFNSDDFNSVIV